MTVPVSVQGAIDVLICLALRRRTPGAQTAQLPDQAAAKVHGLTDVVRESARISPVGATAVRSPSQPIQCIRDHAEGIVGSRAPPDSSRLGAQSCQWGLPY